MASEPSFEEIEACNDLHVLVDILRDEGFYHYRKAAATALGRLGDEQAIGPLIQAFDDENNTVGEAAAEALAVIGVASVAPLTQVLDRKESSWKARTRAVQALGKIDDERRVEYIIRALDDDRAEVRRAATLCLSAMERQHAVDPLIRALKDEDFFVRDCAAGALGWLGDPKAVNPLVQALNDESPDVRDSAERALARLKEQKG